MAYQHRVQQTKNSGLDKEMRLSVDPEFSRFVRSKRNFYAMKNFTVKEQWVMLPSNKKHISWKERSRKKHQWS